MKRFLLFLTVFLSTLAFAGERVIINPEQDQDIKIKVNKSVGGVTDVLTATGSTGALTLGGNPSVVLSPETSTAIWGAKARTAAGNGSNFTVKAGQGSGGGNTSGILYLGAGRGGAGATTGSIAFGESQADDTTTGLNNTWGTIANTGAWRLGSSGGAESSISHSFYYGGVSRAELLRAANQYTGLLIVNDNNSPKLEMMTVESANGYMLGTADGDSLIGWAGNLHLTHDRGTTLSGKIGSTGSWTIGPANDSQTHNIRGGLQINNPGGNFRILGSFTGSAGNRSLCYDASTGSVSFNNGACGTSSRATKKDIVPLADELDSGFIIDSIKPVVFTYRTDFKNHARQIGFIAEEIDQVIPHLTDYDDKGKPENVQYDKTVALLVAEVQALRKRIKTLENNQ